jgi:hypothetical protein
MSKGIQVIERKIEVREFIDLRKAVGWGIPNTASIEKVWIIHCIVYVPK